MGGEWQVKGGSWLVEGGMWQVEGGRWQVEGGRWPVAGGRWGCSWNITFSPPPPHRPEGGCLHAVYGDTGMIQIENLMGETDMLIRGT